MIYYPLWLNNLLPMVIKCISSLIGIRKVHTLFHTCSVILEVRVWKGERYFLVIHQITQQKHFAGIKMSKQFPSSKMKVIISDIIGRNSYLITRPQFLWISGIFCGQAIIQVHWPVSFYGWNSTIDLLQSVFLKKYAFVILCDFTFEHTVTPATNYH